VRALLTLGKVLLQFIPRYVFHISTHLSHLPACLLTSSRRLHVCMYCMYIQSPSHLITPWIHRAAITITIGLFFSRTAGRYIGSPRSDYICVPFRGSVPMAEDSIPSPIPDSIHRSKVLRYDAETNQEDLPTQTKRTSIGKTRYSAVECRT